jgi:hypothetical protein
MGLMDKVKQQAEQALAKAQQGVSQGQAKFDQVQAKRQTDVLLRNLGAAYYAKERSGGGQDAVDAAMKMLDEHAAADGPLDTSTAPTQDAAASGDTTGSQAPPAAAATEATADAGSFSIEDA